VDVECRTCHHRFEADRPAMPCPACGTVPTRVCWRCRRPFTPSSYVIDHAVDTCQSCRKFFASPGLGFTLPNRADS
jgi:Zn finger protein HypA/HybF involved in hydrogenase expression